MEYENGMETSRQSRPSSRQLHRRLYSRTQETLVRNTTNDAAFSLTDLILDRIVKILVCNWVYSNQKRSVGAEVDVCNRNDKSWYLLESKKSSKRISTSIDIASIIIMVVTVSNLHVYPIKSCAPLADPTQATVTPTGFTNDRLAQVIDETGKYCTPRDKKYAELFRVQPSIEGGKLTLRNVQLL